MIISTPRSGNVRLAATSLGIGLALALAAPYPVTAQEATLSDACSRLAEYAEVIMEARQYGVPLGEALGLIEGNKLLKDIVMDAWSFPRMSVPANQQREIDDFRDMWHLACLQSE